MTFTSNALAVLIAAVGAWIFGAAYYGALGKQWVAAQGRTMDEFRQAQAAKVGNITAMLPFLLSFAGALIMAWVLNGILFHIGSYTVRGGMVTAAFCWFGFVLTSMTVNNAYQGRSWRLTAIDAGHWLGALLIVGGIVGGVGGR
jgi:hypothetical protein